MRKCYLFNLVLTFLILANSIWASDTVIKDASLVAPFNLCFSNAGPDSWSNKPFGANHVVFVKNNLSSPLCFNEKLSIENYQQLTAFEKDFFVAVSMWQSYFKSSNRVNIRVIVDNSKPRFSGGAMPGAKIKRTTASQKKVEVTYPSALSTMLGNNPSHLGYDIQVTIKPLRSATFNQSRHCYDQTPTGERNCTPEVGHDLTSVIVHELGHGYGISSARSRQDNNPNYGDFFKNHVLAFDFQTNNDDKHNALLNKYNPFFSSGKHPILFTGASTVEYLRSQGLPEYLNVCNLDQDDHNHSQNFSHFCNIDCSKPASATNVQDLMGGQWCLWKPQSKTRLEISSLDLHILSDIGYAKVLRTTTQVPNLRGYLFNPKASASN